MLIRAILISFFFAVSAHAAELSPEDLRPRPYVQQNVMQTEQRLELLKLLEGASTKYLAELETISFKTFEHVQGPPAVIASLVNEAEDARNLMREFVAQVKALQKDPKSTVGWLLLVRNFYLIADYASDLDRRKVVKSQNYVGIRMLLPAVLDRILIPGASSG